MSLICKKFIFITVFFIMLPAILSPVAYSSIPPGFEEFQENVKKQARKYPDIFFLQGPGSRKKIALTFDDGPDAVYTPAVLDILKKYQVPATFFLIGKNVSRYPEITSRIVSEGHTVGNHSWSHPDFRELSFSEILEQEILPTYRIIKKIAGQEHLLLRPPYGAIADETIELLGQEDWKIINWSLDTFDWYENYNEPQTILDRVLDNIHPEAIILMHSGGGNRDNTLKALPLIIEALQAKGYSFTTVNKLLF